MYKYKNIGKITAKFRAAANAENPSVKKVYEVKAGETIEMPVKISAQNMAEVTMEKTKEKKD